MAENVSNDKSCDIIIPVYNQPGLTRSCLESICRLTRTPYRLIIIDNASDAGTKKMLSDFAVSHANVTLCVNTENVGWVKAVNQGIGQSSAAYVCIMNNDTVVETDDWLGKLIGIAGSEADIGLVNPSFDSALEGRSLAPYIEVDFCRGYCIVVKREVLNRIGGLDEAYGLGYYDDDDFSVRAIRAGFRCIKVWDVVVRHVRDSTFSELFEDQKRRKMHQANKELFYAKWGRRLNLMVVVTRPVAQEKLAGLLLGLARRQHLVYLWSATPPQGLEHSNIRHKSLHGLLAWPICAAVFVHNRAKQEIKRYGAVLVDDRALAAFLQRLDAGSKQGARVHYIDSDGDAEIVYSIVDSAAKVSS